MRFILASNNQNKLRELREMLSEFGYDVISQREAGLNLEVEETGTTFAENAFLKADACAKALGEPAIADDSGLMVDFLHGEPGVYSARYGGGISDEAKCDLILEKLGSTKLRSAKFVSSIVCIFPNGDAVTAEGECHGEIFTKKCGSNGFGYDPVFYVPVLGKTMAQMSPEEKNAISHRGNALKAFRAKLSEYLEEHYADK